MADGHAASPGGQPPGVTAPAPNGRICTNCDAPLQADQEWCLQCGAGQPGSLGERPNWRPLTTLALSAALLVGAAAAAGAAALSSHKATPPRVVAVVPAPGTATTGTTPPQAAQQPQLPTTPPAAGTASTPTVPAVKVPKGGSPGGLLFPSTGKPPKIPSSTSTPQSTGTGTSGSSTGSGKAGSGIETGAPENSPTTPTEANGGEAKPKQPNAIVLDTDAASTYNPYSYPEAGFGDAALAIDGEMTTAWTAQVQPSSAPRMAVGLLIDLKTATKLGSLELRTLAPGMTVQIYGARGHKAPATITEPGWNQLSSSHVLRKKTTRLKLRTKGKAMHYVVVWIIKAPSSAIGTPQAPGQVSLNEVELFPPAG